MELITQGFTILLLLLVLNASSSFARPSEEGDASGSTTPESIETIFRKYDQEYPFHGGNKNEDERNVQNDAPVIEAIIERLNEIIDEDQPSKFILPNADVSEHQRSLLRKQKDELVFGHGRINRRVKESLNRGNVENSGLLNLDQNPFFNKDLLADSYYNRPADRIPVAIMTSTTTRRPLTSSRIPVRTSTRFPNRRPSPPKRTTTTTTTVAPGHHFQETAAGEKITELITDGLLTKPEGNKLSIPVLSVATPDFEEDLPQKPVIVTKPSKVTAQTDDFDDAFRNQYENYRRQAPLMRKRRDSYDWLSRFSSWFNFYGETEGEVEQGRKMSALIKRQIPTVEGDVKPLESTVAAEPVPVPEEVKSVDTPPQVSDAVIETILDIDDPQTRSEFAKDVPAIEDKLEQLEVEAEANQQTVEVAIVELGKTEPEELGRVVEELQPAAINESRQLVVESISEAIEKLAEDVPVETPKALELDENTPEMKVLRNQMPDDFSRSGNPPPAKIVDIVSAIPSEIISVITTSETIRDVPEEEDTNAARSIEPVAAAAHNEVHDEVEEKLAFIEVDRVVPIATPVQTSESIPAATSPDQVVTENIITETRTTINEPSVIPISHTMLVEEKIVQEGDHDAKLIKIAVEEEIVNGQSLAGIAAAPEISNDELVVVSEGKPRAEDMELVIEDRRPQFENPEITLAVDDTKINSAAAPQTKTPIVVEQEQDFEIVIEPEADDEPVPKALDVNKQLAAVTTQEPETATTTTVGRTELKDHVVEEAVLITTDSAVSEQSKTLEDPSVPLISENVDSRLNSMIIAEVLEDENMEVGYNSIVPTTILPLDWLKEDFSGAANSNPSSSSGSESNSMSTTESTSDAEQLGTTPYGSSEEDDGSRERDAEKQRRKEEKRRLKEEERRLRKEAEERRKAEEKDNSSEEVKVTAKLSVPEEQKLTKEEMVNIFSSPEMEIDLRRLDTATTERVIEQVISEVVETQQNISTDHLVIKKDGVEIEDDDDSAESGEVTTINPELLQQLNEALDHEMQEVEKVLEVLENALGETIKTETAAVVDTDVADAVEQSNAVITSKNTRHLVKVGYRDDFIEKDNFPDVAEARLGDQSASETAFNEYNSRAFVLIGSGLFLITGFVLFALVVLLIKRTRRYGSLDLTVQA